ncbi:MAG: 30S ribosomal protein S27ae [Candidatus Nanoarchaeia archaeon]
MAKKKVKNKKPSQKWKKYKIENNKIVSRGKTCPKCNSFLGTHKDRLHCGSCGYVEIIKK